MWCTYSYFNKDLPQYIGKIEKITKSYAYIRYSNNKNPLACECWDLKFVKTFEKLEDVVIFFLNKNKEETLESVKNRIFCCFEDDFNKINWDNLI